MTHGQSHDQNLFLLSVGELSGLAALSAKAHLITCRACQARYVELQRSSIQIRPRFTDAPAPVGKLLSIAQIKLQLMIYVIAIIAAVSISVGTIAIVHAQHGAPTPVVHCLPGIASDQCR